MKPFYARALAVMVLTICFSSSAFAQLGSIVGKVFDKDGKPIAGATVNIDRPEIKLHYEMKTDKNGLYSRLGVDDGTYQVTIVQNGTTIAADNVVVSLGYRVDKTFDLSKPGGAGGGVAGGAANAANKAQLEAEQKANTATQGAYNAGVTALTAKNYEEAIKQLTLAAQRQPKVPFIFARLAEANVGARKSPEAIDAYKKAIELKADEPDYRYQLGMLYLQTNSMPDAATQFDKYLQLAPKGENAATAKQLLDAAKAAK